MPFVRYIILFIFYCIYFFQESPGPEEVIGEPGKALKILTPTSYVLSVSVLYKLVVYRTVRTVRLCLRFWRRAVKKLYGPIQSCTFDFFPTYVSLRKLLVVDQICQKFCRP